MYSQYFTFKAEAMVEEVEESDSLHPDMCLFSLCITSPAQKVNFIVV